MNCGPRSILGLKDLGDVLMAQAIRQTILDGKYEEFIIKTGISYLNNAINYYNSLMGLSRIAQETKEKGLGVTYWKEKRIFEEIQAIKPELFEQGWGKGIKRIKDYTKIFGKLIRNRAVKKEDKEEVLDFFSHLSNSGYLERRLVEQRSKERKDLMGLVA